MPTIGFNVETLRYKNIKFQVWDLGGQTSIRPYWRCYYPNTDAIIFVVDSTDVERLELAKAELFALLDEEELKDAILLIMANKQDMKGALKAPQLSDAIGLAAIKNRQWSIQETSATQGKGLFDGFDVRFASPIFFGARSEPSALLTRRPPHPPTQRPLTPLFDFFTGCSGSCSAVSC